MPFAARPTGSPEDDTRRRIASAATVLRQLAASLPLEIVLLAPLLPPPSILRPRRITQADVDDAVAIVLGLAAAVEDQRARSAVWMRAWPRPVPLRKIGRILGCSHTAAAALEGDAVAALTRWLTCSVSGLSPRLPVEPR